MLFLWIYGDNVEHRLGPLYYLVAYLGTGFAATMGDGLLRMGSAIPSVGASGAISGVLGLYFIWFPRNRVRLWVFFFPFFANIIELRARIVLGFYILIENLLPVLLTAGGPGGVSYGAHIGGFVAGLGLAAGLDRIRLSRPERDVRQRPRSEPGPDGALGAFRRALDTGHWDVAAEWFFSTPHAATRTGLGPGEKVRLGNALEQNGHPHAALAAYQRAVADHPRDAGRIAAHLGAARVLMDDLRNPTAAYQHLYSALEAEPGAEQEREARALLERLSRLVRNLPSTPIS
jgi:hypothetical protein